MKNLEMKNMNQKNSLGEDSMRYKTEELENMSKEELIKIYRNAKTPLKKDILKSLSGSGMFAILMSQLYPEELIEMANVHPYKEAVVDTMISEMEFHGAPVTKHLSRDNLDKFMNALQHKSFFTKIKEAITRKPALPANMPKKIEHVKELYKIENRRINANGKKMEQLENQDLEQAVDNSRVEVNSGEMAKVFDKYAKEARKAGNIRMNDNIAKNVTDQLTGEYVSALGTEKEDIARLVAMEEFENYSGNNIYVPYSRNI